MKTRKGFASDNNSGIHPDILRALSSVNEGHVPAYGNDPYTLRAREKLQEHFGADADVYFVFNGTGANVLALRTMADTWQSILCSEYSHIYEDECGAPEKVTGCKLVPLRTQHGKFRPEQIAEHLVWLDDEHRVQPCVVSITQTTEFGTVYSVEEIRAITDFCHNNGLLVHMDGARIANAAAALDLPFRAFTRDAGVDVVSFGGTKNGMLMGEAVIFFDKELSKRAKYYRKQNMQLNSKMRFVAAQFEAYLSDDLWKKNAAHSNRMARLLHESVKGIPGVEVVHPVEANGIFAVIPREITPSLQEQYSFYVFNEHTNMVRWMCSFDTTEEDIAAFAEALKKALKNS